MADELCVTTKIPMFPDEVLLHIFEHLDSRTLCRCCLVSHQYHRIASSDGLWKTLLRKEYKFWNSPPDWSEKFRYKDVFNHRKYTDRQVQKSLEQIIQSSIGRITNYHHIANRYNYDAIDILLQNHYLKGSDILTRKYYSRSLVHYLRRRKAFSVWSSLVTGTEIPNFDITVSYFSHFYGTDCIEISSKLDTLTKNFKEEYLDEFEASSLDQKCGIIGAFMNQRGISGATGADYYRIENSFIHFALNRVPTLPITLAAIFCGIARRLEIHAAPVDFPGHVYVTVSETADFRNNIYIDIYNVGRLISRLELEQSLASIGEPPSPIYLSPASAIAMIRRVFRNIINSIQQGEDSRNGKPLALYSAIAALLTMNNEIDERTRDIFASIIQNHFPMDVDILEQVISRLQNFNDTGELSSQCRSIRSNDNTPLPIHRRQNTSLISYRIGDVFQHKRYSYVAVITGYTEVCNTAEEWIRAMRIDELNRGRDQPFYHVIAEDGSSRYVAEENIRPINDIASCEIFQDLEDIGKYFRRFNQETGRFVPAPDLEISYPDDI
ncbi:F-box only protein 21 [Neolecta irregularis DAH-3]|uniref:F-box only protein 21 n=1 Tax=Neolecta irregularis (strain DAH-3) TaxID=1198029 RepID=A0A1U7LPU2_NEOID|nr:F-box only protein 21 [Neolecta irregularis DAH-3]|eukprot:OLL24686.1 F-box only protein 21 [Neolecta irregularis DAH-3]